MPDVAAHGRRLGRDRLQGRQRALRRGRRRPWPGFRQVIDQLGYEASLGSAEPAQPPHQRARHPGRRLRAVQRPSCSRAPPTRSEAPTTSCSSTPPGPRGSHVGWERRYLVPAAAARSSTAPSSSPPPWSRSSYGLPSWSPSTRTPGRPGCRRSTPTTSAAASWRPSYLLELGHRRIGIIAGRPDLESARLREEGYREALAAAGVPVDEDLVRVGGVRRGDGRGMRPHSC